ncbi:MAG: hypothetical protein ACRC6X_07920 [Culicoidibacterales bacterium]
MSLIKLHPRSNPETYLGVLDSIRKVMAKKHGVHLETFSANSVGGCSKCKEKGLIGLNLSFMDATQLVYDL